MKAIRLTRNRHHRKLRAPIRDISDWLVSLLPIFCAHRIIIISPNLLVVTMLSCGSLHIMPAYFWCQPISTCEE
jgi:hypothetical protein